MNGMYEELLEKLRKNNRMSGWTHIDRLMDDAIKAIEALQQEIEQLKTQVARMREALESIKRLDKTEYTYYGARARNKNGELPPDGERWKTPMEIAMGVISTDIDQDYHNPADVEILKKIKWHIENYTQTGILDELDCAIAEIDKQIGGKDND